MNDKVREITLRRKAARRGLRLIRSRRRDPLALDYGLYWLLPADDTRENTTHAGLDPADGMTLDQVEQRLTGGTRA
jgi:hypothetical protein